MQIKTQLKEKTWRDEAGTEVPANRITPLEKMKEKHSYKIASDASKINKHLSSFKTAIKTLCTEVFDNVMTAQEKQKATKGNFTWYNFDGSIKIEVSINENIEFDGLLIEKCKQKLLEIVGESISQDKAFIKELVLSAFQTSKGRLDTKKIMSLKKYSSRIKDERYQQAMTFLDESIRRPDSKTYFRVWVKDENGQYQNIDLNFSSIEA